MHCERLIWYEIAHNIVQTPFLWGYVTNLDGIALCVYRGRCTYLVSVFAIYFSVRTVVYAVKFQALHSVAQISANCCVTLQFINQQMHI